MRKWFSIAALVALGCGGVTTLGETPGGDAGLDGSSDGAIGPDSVDGGVVFRLTIAGATSGFTYCVGLLCGGPWLSISSATGDRIETGNACMTDCATCQGNPCPPPVCGRPRVLFPSGEETTWDGTYYVKDVCNAGTSCLRAERAAKGAHFVVTMCAGFGGDPVLGGLGACDQAMDHPTKCVDVPFDYPSGHAVVGVLPLTP